MYSDRITSGIPGLDDHMKGGFIKNSVNLISGGAGTGKTILTAQFLLDGIINHDQNGLYISLEQDLISLLGDLKSLGWDFEKLQQMGKCKFVFLGPFSQRDILNNILKEVTKANAERVVIDSLTIFGMSIQDGINMRRAMYELMALLKRLNCTVLLTSEVQGEVNLDISATSSLSRFGIEEFMCDSVLTLHSAGLGGSLDRALRVVKMRRTDHTRGPIPMQITSRGMVVAKKED